MAGPLHTLCSTFALPPDSSLSAHARTRPCMPPAPPLQPRNRTATDNIRVEELAEADAGYMGDLDLVTPDEVEEMSSSDGRAGSYSRPDTASDTDTEADGLIGSMSQVRFGDDRDAVFERLPPRRTRQKRADSRLFKRSHSQSVESETEVTDSDAMPDQDRQASKRRLRRRTQAPHDPEFVFDDLPPSSLSARPSPEVVHDQYSSAADSGLDQNNPRQAVDAHSIHVGDAK